MEEDAQSCRPYAGVWKRQVNYEPRDVVADDSRVDGSLVYWLQAPSGEYMDFRSIKTEQFHPRGFTGTLSVSPNSADRTATLTWTRHLDSKPSSCPGGVDSAVARWAASNVLLEEGDGYLEVWERVAEWEPSYSTCLLLGKSSIGSIRSGVAWAIAVPESDSGVSDANAEEDASYFEYIEIKIGCFKGRAALRWPPHESGKEDPPIPMMLLLSSPNVESPESYKPLVSVESIQ